MAELTGTIWCWYQCPKCGYRTQQLKALTAVSHACPKNRHRDHVTMSKES